MSKLTLSHGVPFSEKTMPLVCQYLKTNAQLSHLDISWNKLKPEWWTEFLGVLAEDRKLKSLSL